MNRNRTRRATPPGGPGGGEPRGLGRGRLRRILAYGASRGATEILLGARGLLLAHLLGPAAFGGWALFRLISRYGAFMAVGALPGLERESVRARGSSRDRNTLAEHSLARTTLGFTLAVFVPLAAAALIASFAVSDPVLVAGLRGFAAAVVLEQTLAYALVCLRSRGELRRYAGVEVASAMLHLTLAPLFALRWGLAGALTGFALASMGSVALIARQVPFRPSLSRAALRRLLGVGFPVAIASVVSVSLATADRWVVALLGGTTLLGYYAFAVAIAGLASSFAWVIRTVIFPDVYGGADRHGTRVAVRRHVQHTLLPFAWLYPPLLGALAIAIGPAVRLAVPQYVEAIAPARLFIFTSTSFGIVSLGALGVIAADRQRILPLFSTVALLLNVGLSAAALHVGAGLEGVAGAALFSQALYAGSVLAITASAAELDHPLRTAARGLVPLGWCALAVFGIGRLVPEATFTAFANSAGLYALALLPLLPAMRRQLRTLVPRDAVPPRGVTPGPAV